ncbi:MAG: hypothetical protein K8R40_10280 [Anaerolineaceae bacterium]|nr:hypothetical protein [Anaerolineaceae bacterium]
MDIVLSFEKIVEYIRLNFSVDTQIYLVGGVVRDMILGIPSNDIDIVLTGNARLISRSIANHFSGDFYPLDEERHTYRVILHDSSKKDMILDIALMRGESIEEDLKDRDFTINAIALDVSKMDEGVYIDPLDGIGAIENQLISACSEQSLVNDPVRVLRAIRFACQFNSVFGKKTKAAMQAVVPRLNETSSERVRDEFFKMLGKTYTRECLNHCLQFGLAQRLFSKYEKCPDDWQRSNELINNLNHFLDEEKGRDTEQLSYQSFIRTYNTNICEYLEEIITSDRSVIKLLNLAILLHKEFHCFLSCNLGEGGRKEKLQSFLKKRSADFVLSNHEINFLLKLIAYWDVLPDSIKIDRLFAPIDIYRFFRASGDAGIGLCLISCASVRYDSEDMMRKTFSTVSNLVSAYWNSYQEIIAPDCILDGNDLIHEFHLKPGPQFKAYLEALQEEQVTGTVRNREAAISFIKQKILEFSETGN